MPIQTVSRCGRGAVCAGLLLGLMLIGCSEKPTAPPQPGATANPDPGPPPAGQSEPEPEPDPVETETPAAAPAIELPSPTSAEPTEG